MKTTLSIICLITMLCSCVATGEQVKTDPQPEAAFTITIEDIAKLNSDIQKASAAMAALPAYKAWLKAREEFKKKANAFIAQSEMGREWSKQDKALRSKWDRTPEFNLLQDLREKAKMYHLLKTTKE